MYILQSTTQNRPLSTAITTHHPCYLIVLTVFIVMACRMSKRSPKVACQDTAFHEVRGVDRVWVLEFGGTWVLDTAVRDFGLRADV